MFLVFGGGVGVDLLDEVVGVGVGICFLVLGVVVD